MILSDILVVSQYLSPGAYQAERSLAQNGVTINPPPDAVSSAAAVPAVAAVGAPAAAGAVPTDAQKEALLAQMRQATGMNAQFAGMCLEQNGWDYEVAMRNFEDIKATIPPEAFQQ